MSLVVLAIAQVEGVVFERICWSVDRMYASWDLGVRQDLSLTDNHLIPMHNERICRRQPVKPTENCSIDRRSLFGLC